MHIVIIGAGVLGCAIARHLRQVQQQHTVQVVEALPQAGQLTSKNNSGVLHAGMHLRPGSLKATLAQRGRTLAINYCQERGICVLQTGMLIVSTWHDALRALRQAPEFIRILRQGKRMGIQLDILTPSGIGKREPHVRGLLGISADDVAIIDGPAFVQSVMKDALELGATFRFSSPVEHVERTASGWLLQGLSGNIHADFLINAGGPGAEALADLCGVIHFVQYVRGEYAEVVDGNQGRFNSLVYPVPRPGEGGLGVHITPTVDGRLLLGPNTVPVDDPHDTGQIEPRARLDFFRDRVAPFWPEVRDVKLAFGPVGIRTKSYTGDFVFHAENQAVHVLGYESPGFTAALAAAEHIVQNLIPSRS